MKVYVIGNGFDLAHNLHTSYHHYREYIKKHADKNNGWGVILEYYPEDHEFWSDAETNICKINRERFLEPKLAFYFSDLDVLFAKIHESFERFIIDNEKTIDTSQQLFKFDEDALYLTFNYTSVLEEVYKIPSEKIIHLHNTAGDAVLRRYFNLDSNEIVLGHGPNFRHYFFYSDVIIGGDKDYIAFRNKTLKNTGEIIKMHNLDLRLLRIQKYVDEVVFYGFSFSPNDQEYVQKIMMCLSLPQTKYKLYYHVGEKETDDYVIKRFTDNMIKCAFDFSKVEMINCENIKTI